MIRLVLRMAFWACLLVTILPGLHKSDVKNEDLNITMLATVIKATALDLSNFCIRNSSVCETGLGFLTLASVATKDGLLSAYYGITRQNDDVDHKSVTSTIKRGPAD